MYFIISTRLKEEKCLNRVYEGYLNHKNLFNAVYYNYFLLKHLFLNNPLPKFVESIQYRK